MTSRTHLSVQPLEARENPSGWGRCEAMPCCLPMGTDSLATDCCEPTASQHVRHRMFAIVDRTMMMPVESSPSVTGRITGVAVDPMDQAPDGRKFKMLVAPLILEGSADAPGGTHGKYLTPRPRPADAPVCGDCVMMGADVSEAERTGPFYNFTSGRLVREAGDSFYGTGVYKSTDSGRTWSL